MADIYGRPDREHFLPAGASQSIQRHLSKIGAVGLFFLSALMLVALVTYDMADPSFNQVQSQQQQIQNGAGKIGAYIADLLWQSLGLGAFALTAAIGLLGYMLWQRKQISSLTLAAIPAISLSSAVAVSFLPNFIVATQTGAGGVLGDMLPSLFVAILGSVFGTILSILLALAAAFGTGRLAILLWEGAMGEIGFAQKKRQRTASRMQMPYEKENLLLSLGKILFIQTVNYVSRGQELVKSAFGTSSRPEPQQSNTPEEFFNIHSFSANRFEDLQPPTWPAADRAEPVPELVQTAAFEAEQSSMADVIDTDQAVEIETAPHSDMAVSAATAYVETDPQPILDVSKLQNPENLPPTKEFVTPATQRRRDVPTEIGTDNKRHFMIMDAIEHEVTEAVADIDGTETELFMDLEDSSDTMPDLTDNHIVSEMINADHKPESIVPVAPILEKVVGPDLPVRPIKSADFDDMEDRIDPALDIDVLFSPAAIAEAQAWLDIQMAAKFAALDARQPSEPTAFVADVPESAEISEDIDIETEEIEFSEGDFAAAVGDFFDEEDDEIEVALEAPISDFADKDLSGQVIDISDDMVPVSQHIEMTAPVQQVAQPILPPVASRPAPAMQPFMSEDTADILPAPVAASPSAMAQPIADKPAGQPASPMMQMSETATQTLPDYLYPPLDLLKEKTAEEFFAAEDEAVLTDRARQLESVLADFGVKGEIVKVRPGPVVTLYELEPAPGTKSSRVIGLSDDIARSMSAVSVRIAVVPGRTVIGIELPNPKRELVRFRELLESDISQQAKEKLPLILGKDIGGAPIIADLAKMPHLLVAGTTGSGKSVAINTMILSLLYHLPPEKCRFIMVDPKMLELSVYNDIPHLLSPVVTDPRKAVVALKWAVREMEDRYKRMSMLNVRNIENYNMRMREAQKEGEILMRKVQTGFDPETGRPVYEEQPLPLEELPYIVIVVDEMADLMLVAGKDIEAAIQRLAQMARAAGIHIIMATQRPSVDVITGTIKANFPTRISFQVTSKIDSRTIIGEPSAETLLGQGDMLYMAGGGRLLRVHGPFVSDQEVEHVVDHLKAQGVPDYIESVTFEDDLDEGAAATTAEEKVDELYDQAVSLVIRQQKASTSFVQRQLQIGYNRAARLIERMEAEKIISPANQAGKRDVLVEKDQFEE